MMKVLIVITNIGFFIPAIIRLHRCEQALRIRTRMNKPLYNQIGITGSLLHDNFSEFVLLTIRIDSIQQLFITLFAVCF
jgi:hypothetical protein